MLGQHADLLKTAVTTINNWRNTAAGANIELDQVNLIFPDGEPVVLKWNDEAVENPDGTFTGDWAVDS